MGRKRTTKPKPIAPRPPQRRTTKSMMSEGQIARPILKEVKPKTVGQAAYFKAIKENIITFGSMDKTGAAAIKQGTPYKLIFTPKQALTNTSGLIYTYFAEAVDKNANKVILNIK